MGIQASQQRPGTHSLIPFDWDPNKARKNLKKHGVSFGRAAEIFLDSSAISIHDKEHSDQEERWNIRIISARKGTRKEKKQYEEGAK